VRRRDESGDPARGDQHPAHRAPVGRSPSSRKVATSDSSGIDGTTMAVVRARSRRVIAAYHSNVPIGRRPRPGHERREQAAETPAGALAAPASSRDPEDGPPWT
jgi:hypothetical protein